MPPRNKITDLRDHLFETLEALRDEEKPMDIERAKTIAHVAQVIVDSARVEVKHLQVTGGLYGTGFLPDGEAPAPAKPRLAAGTQR